MKIIKEENRLSKKQRKAYSAVAIVAVIIFTAVIAWFVGRPMISFVSEPEKFREFVKANGVFSRLAFIGMMVFQVVIAFVPGEPLEIGAGYAFGSVEGTLLCVAGITLGSLIVFVLVKRFGLKLVEVFFTFEKIKSLKFLQNEKKLDFLTFVVFFLPGTPKDLLTYFVGLTDIKFSKFLIIASVARLPSVITSTVGGSALGMKDYTFAIIVFAATLLLSVAGLLIYNRICAEKRVKKEK